MVNTANTFVFSVFTFYTFYRYILQQNEFFEKLLWTHLRWELFYLFPTLIFIYTTDLVATEASIVHVYDGCFHIRELIYNIFWYYYRENWHSGFYTTLSIVAVIRMSQQRYWNWNKHWSFDPHTIFNDTFNPFNRFLICLSKCSIAIQ